MRVNARLDDSYQTKIDYIVETCHSSVSDVMRDAIDHYYEAVKAEQVRRVRGLDSIVGMAEGVDVPTDLSTNYKKYIGEIIDAKYPQHAHR
ncbi:MAG: ribbon-helix-helix domain-containing protein [Rhodocyclaceae bacterium]|nr:ribbon-helix-helix domain-containing protein [Rhodocyclaceae bacterium]